MKNKNKIVKTDGNVSVAQFSKERGVDSVAVNHMVLRSWFANGFNAAAAIKEVTGVAMDDTEARKQLERIRTSHKDIVKRLQEESAARNNVSADKLIRELINYIDVDPTVAIGLSHNELKSLPASYKKAIQRITTKQRDIKNNQGEVVATEVQLDVLFVDKMQAIKELAKHIDFYSKHNKGRAKINIQRLSIENINAVIQAMDRE